VSICSLHCKLYTYNYNTINEDNISSKLSNIARQNSLHPSVNNTNEYVPGMCNELDSLMT